MKQARQAVEPEGAPTASRAWRLWARVTRFVLWSVAGLWVVFFLTWLGLQAWIVPRIGEWRPDLERWATRAVGIPVTVGAIRAIDRPAGWLPPLIPSFDVTDVRLLDAQGREALHLPLVQGALSVASLWRGRFEQILIERPVLDIRRRSDGRIDIAGITFGDSGPSDHAAARWFFDQPEFVVRGGTVRWTDERRALPALQLTDVDLVARNGVRSHDLRLDATPEPAWGDRFTLRARLREPLIDLLPLPRNRAAPWARWRGTLHADLPRVDVTRLRDRVDLPAGVDVRGGLGRLSAWGGVVEGRLANLTVDAQITGVEARLGADLPALALDTLAGRVDADWDERGFAMGTDNLSFRTREGLAWPGGRVRIEHRHARLPQGASTAVQADRVELEALAALAGGLPLPSEARDWLQRLAPRGRLENADLRWQGRSSGPDAPRTMASARGRVVGLALAGEPSGRMSASQRYPMPGRPGIEGATIDFDADQDGGTARIALRDGAIVLPDVLEQPRVSLARLDARARWRVQGERIDVDLDEVQLANDDLQGTARASWHTGDPATSPARARLPGVLDLTATVQRFDATAVHRYLPLTVPVETRHYLRDAVRSGRASDVAIRIQGELWDMPLAMPSSPGTFRIAAGLDGLDFDYRPGSMLLAGEAPWPGVRGARGSLLLDRTVLRIEGLDAGVAGQSGLRLSRGQVGIDDLMRDPRVDVSARVQGPASEVLAVVQTSPLNGMLNGALARARVGGAASGTLRLELPLFDLRASRVAGTLRLDGSDVRVVPEAPLLANTRGALTFSERGFAFTGARSQLYGGEVVFDGSLRPGPQGEPQLMFKGQGTATAAALRDTGPGFVARLLQRASGSAAYGAQLGFRAGVPELLITTSLQGMALDLPAPLGKTAEAALPLRLETSVPVVEGGTARTDRVAMQLGPPVAPLVDVQIERDIRGPAPRVLRGTVALGAGAALAALPVQGVVANVQLAELDVDAWERAFAAAPVAPGTSAAPSGPAGGASGGVADIWPTLVSLRADRVLTGGHRFNGVVLGASRAGPLWRANVNADELNGYIEYRPPGDGQSGNVYARLARLTLSPGAPREVEQLLQQPTSVPALDIAVDDLRWGGRSLGRVEVDAVNRGGAGRVAEWRLNALRMTVPEARLSASGNWAPLADGSGAVRRTVVTFRLDVDDSGALLARFGRPGLVRGGKGRLQGNAGWLGSPFALDHASLGGALQAEFERGQFLQADAGAARLLGVLSLQALPRRLALDFRDVFSEGFAFDFVRGDARIERGILSTNNLQMKGVNAAVLMEGTADLAREQQDLKVVVVPELNAGTASLIATAINPAVGLGSFLAQFLLRQPLQSAATQEFHVTGGWADPQVEKRVRGATPPASSPTPTLQ